MSSAKQDRAATPSVPVSWGELIDKLTILEIKADRIEGASARKNVLAELDLLRGIAGPALSADALLAERKGALKQVNETLWEIEDNIRAKEKSGAFDAEFIELARSVYKRNDERARLKKQINVHTASEIVEEKSYRDY